MEIYLLHARPNRISDDKHGFIVDLSGDMKAETLEDYQCGIFRDRKDRQRILPIWSTPTYYEYPGHYGKIKGFLSSVTVQDVRKLDDYFDAYNLKRTSGVWVNTNEGLKIAQVYVHEKYEPFSNMPPENYLCPSPLYDRQGRIVEIGRDWQDADGDFYYDFTKSLKQSYKMATLDGVITSKTKSDGRVQQG